MSTNQDARTDPATQYGERREAAQAEAAALETREAWLRHLRLLSAAVAVVLAWLSFGTHSLAAGWLLAPAGVFSALAIVHDRAIRRRERAERRAAFYEAGCARLEDRWAGTGNSGDPFKSDDHLFNDDLDLFGSGSLFELLCSARTPAGEEMLARWLEAPAGREVVLDLRGTGRVVRVEDPPAGRAYGEDGIPLTGVAVEFTSPLSFHYCWV